MPSRSTGQELSLAHDLDPESSPRTLGTGIPEPRRPCDPERLRRLSPGGPAPEIPDGEALRGRVGTDVLGLTGISQDGRSLRSVMTDPSAGLLEVQ